MESMVKKEVLGKTIEARYFEVGNDLLVIITGGDAPHVGSVSVCQMHSNKLRLLKIVLPMHRDDVISDKLARILAERLNTTVCVVCGIHYNQLKKQEITEIVKACDELMINI